LNQICKSYKRNKKIEKEKEKRRKNIYKTDPGEPFGPAGETARGPFQPPRTGAPESLFPSPTGGPQLLVIFLLRPEFTLVTESSLIKSPLQFD
jgi:hypothetical protein